MVVEVLTKQRAGERGRETIGLILLCNAALHGDGEPVCAERGAPSERRSAAQVVEADGVRTRVKK